MTKIQEITTREKQICFLLSQWREKGAKALSDLNAKEISKMGRLVEVWYWCHTPYKPLCRLYERK